MITKAEAIERFKHSLKIKEQMKKNADERLETWKCQLEGAGLISNC